MLRLPDLPRKYYIIAGALTLILLSATLLFAYTQKQKNRQKIVQIPEPSPSLTVSPTPEVTPPAASSPSPTPTPTPIPSATASQNLSQYIMIKNFGEPQFENFGLSDTDFKNLKDAGFNLIGVEFDICAGDQDVTYLLNTAQKYNLKVVLPAGAGEAEWGYECDKEYPLTQGPVWQKEKVQQWVKKWKDYPAVFGWDSSNEDGLNFPNGENNPAVGQNWTKYSMTVDQLKTAYNDIKAVDSKHPIMIRMSGFFFYDFKDNYFRAGNYFAKDISDIVMVNAYSNYLDPYESNFVSNTIDKAQKSIRAVDNDVKLMVALASWKELNDANVKLPKVSELERDFQQVKEKKSILSGVSYFKYGAKSGNEWYFPDPNRGNQALWQKIIQYNREFLAK